MAESKNSIAKRVQAHKAQAKGMLNPGLRPVTSGEKSSGSLPALFTHFSVGKAKEAASKMRVLDYRRMGKMQAETSKSFSQAIPQKFQEAQKLLHVNPSISREETIWNEMDRTLPTQGRAQQYEEPAQPGELRAGSVIQKFSMIPKQGQSIESFKKEVSSLTKPQSVRNVAPQKPKIDRNTRLFSQVQEVSASVQPGSEPEQPQRSPEPPVSVQKVSDPVQRKVEPATPPQTDSPAGPSQPPVQRAEPPQEQSNEEILRSLVRAMDGETESTKPAEEKKQSPPAEMPVQKPAKTVQRKPLAKAAKPASEKRTAPLQKTASSPEESPKTETSPKADVSKPPAKMLPLAKPGAPQVPTVQRKVDVPSAKPVAKTTPPKPPETQPASQPKASVDTPRAVQSEKSQVVESAIDSPAEQKPALPLRDESSQPENIEQPQLKEQATPKDEPAKSIPPSEMPLRRNIQVRREAPKAIKALRPETVKPAESKPLLAPPPRPLISRQKYRRTDVPEVPSEEASLPQKQMPPQVSQVSEAPASAHLPEGFAELDSAFSTRIGQKTQSTTPPAEPMRDGRQALSMALAMPPRTVQPAPLPSAQAAAPSAELLQTRKQREQLPKEAQKLPEQALPTSASASQLTRNISVPSQKVVQRQPDDDTSETASSRKEAAVNLDQLAADVLPYVKRILEIESERVPGDLR